MRYDELSTTPAYTYYSINILETDIIHHTHTEYYVGTCADIVLFSHLEELYGKYSLQGGYVFSKDSIALRMKSMNQVLCWFGYHNGYRYTCYIRELPASIPSDAQ